VTYILKTQQIWLLELLKFQRILLYTVLFVLPIMLTATSPHFDHSCKVCNIMTVIKSLIINNQKRRKFHNLFIQCKTYPNSWKFSWILGYRPCFYTACMLFTFKCHNRDFYHNRDVLTWYVKILTIALAYLQPLPLQDLFHLLLMQTNMFQYLSI